MSFGLLRLILMLISLSVFSETSATLGLLQDVLIKREDEKKVKYVTRRPKYDPIYPVPRSATTSKKGKRLYPDDSSDEHSDEDSWHPRDLPHPYDSHNQHPTEYDSEYFFDTYPQRDSDDVDGDFYSLDTGTDTGSSSKYPQYRPYHTKHQPDSTDLYVDYGEYSSTYDDRTDFGYYDDFPTDSHTKNSYTYKSSGSGGYYDSDSFDYDKYFEEYEYPEKDTKSKYINQFISYKNEDFTPFSEPEYVGYEAPGSPSGVDAALTRYVDDPDEVYGQLDGGGENTEAQETETADNVGSEEADTTTTSPKQQAVSAEDVPLPILFVIPPSTEEEGPGAAQTDSPISHDVS